MNRLVDLTLLALALAACSSVSTSHDYDPDADFEALQTYDWIVPPEDSDISELTYRRVVQSTDEVLAEKGFRRDADAPDFLVAAHLGTERRVRVTDYGYQYRHGPGYYGVRDLEVDEYEEGTLILDVVLAETKALIWRGTATGTVDRTATPQKRAERIRAAVQKVLGPFPPTTGR